MRRDSNRVAVKPFKCGQVSPTSCSVVELLHSDTTKMSNPFFTNDDVDDDEFLKNSRRPNAQSFSAGGGGVGGGARPDPLQQIQERKREIEQRTLDSSQRSISLLYESERTGQATAEELLRQKEQLKQTESRLTDINSTLKQSERHLQGIKSVFGGIRNYFKGGPAAAGVPGAAPMTAGASSRLSTSASAGIAVDSAISQANDIRGDPSRHPGLRVQGREEGGPPRHATTTDDVNAALDRNLDEISNGLSRLKGLAQGLNSELEEQNDLLDNIDDQAARAGLKINQQNKDMNKILGKK